MWRASVTRGSIDGFRNFAILGFFRSFGMAIDEQRAEPDAGYRKRVRCHLVTYIFIATSSGMYMTIQNSIGAMRFTITCYKLMMMPARYSRNFSAIGLIILAFVACSFSAPLNRDARAQSWDAVLTRPGWDLPQFKRAREIYQRGDCRESWDILWPLAKVGNREARYLLWSMTLDRMMPPGRLGAKWDRHHLTLAAYATLVPSPFELPGSEQHRGARKSIQNAIGALKLGPSGDQVAQCYKSGSSLPACLKLATSLGVVQRFEDYAADVDAEARESGLPARCLPRPW
jgi:hypothetical protein